MSLRSVLSKSWAPPEVNVVDLVLEDEGECNNPPRRYDTLTIKYDILIFSESSINLIMKMMVNFS